MKKLFLLILLAVSSVSSFSQVTFEEGFLTNTSGQTSKVYIKVREASGTPTRIDYKLTPDGEIRTAGIADISAFGIGDSYRYTRETVNIDRSSENFKKVSQVRHPEFQEETLFLRTLLKGEFSLLHYEDGELDRFFIKTPGGDIEQLVYKKYSTKENVIQKNNRYKQQLLNFLVCQDISVTNFKNLNYSRTDLMRIFEKYHDCKDLEYDVFFVHQKGEFNLAVKAGINYASLKMEQKRYERENDFDSRIYPQVGVEFEYILPFINRKAALFTEPTLLIYSSEEEVIIATDVEIPSNPAAVGGYKAQLNLKYNSIDLPIGIRYFMFLNEANSAKIFVNGGVYINYVLNSSTITNHSTSETKDLELNEASQPGFFAGFGYRQSDKFSLEFRYLPSRPLSNNGGFKLSQDQSFSLVAGYTIF